MRRSGGRAVLLTSLGVLVLAGCGADPTVTATTSGSATASDEIGTGALDEAPSEPVTALAGGPVTLVALGDSLTAGDGDDAGVGYVGRLLEAIDATPGRSGSTLVNFGASGWDSTMMVDGGDGSPAELGAAVTEVQAAVAAGRAVLATVLIGSNDMWYLYEYGPIEGTPPENEDLAEATLRTNLERTVTELQAAGAVVVLGLPDDQSIRPAVADIDRLHTYLADVTVEEVQQMSVMAGRLARVTTELAAARGLLTVDTGSERRGVDVGRTGGGERAAAADVHVRALRHRLRPTTEHGAEVLVHVRLVIRDVVA